MKKFGLLLLTLGMSCFAFADEGDDNTAQPEPTTEESQEVAQADTGCCEQSDSESSAEVSE